MYFHCLFYNKTIELAGTHCLLARWMSGVIDVHWRSTYVLVKAVSLTSLLDLLSRLRFIVILLYRFPRFRSDLSSDRTPNCNSVKNFSITYFYSFNLDFQILRFAQLSGKTPKRFQKFYSLNFNNKRRKCEVFGKEVSTGTRSVLQKQ